LRKQLGKAVGFFLIIILLTVTPAGWSLDRYQLLTGLSWSILKEWHYQPRKLTDEDFSKDVFHLYLNSLDPDKRFFLASDIEKLREYETAIGKELQEGTGRLMNFATALLSARIQEVQTISEEILAEPFDFFVDEALEIDAEKREYARDRLELRELWRKMLKYQTLLVYLQRSGVGDGEIIPDCIDREIEKQAQEEVKKSLRRTLERMRSDVEEEAVYRFINAVTGSFDPHTSYFTPEKKEDFDIGLTGTLEGIGALLQEEGEYIKVVELIPGGAAWRQGELKPGDIIMKVAEEGKEPVDLFNMRATQAVRYIRGEKGTKVSLTVRKPEGHIVTIDLFRDIVVLEETYARPALLIREDPAGKYGYIYLPSFYRDFSNPEGRNSAGDLKEILEKLRDEKVDGIILDLRDNGGGSLTDALQIAGFFIPGGPLLQIRNREQIEVLMDYQTGVLYDGPMAVLVNSFTASAAEILAAILQDYNRAVIVGNRTFGKGSIQAVVDLDRFVTTKPRGFTSLGSLKLTIQQFYRITGKPIQHQGVTPDILLLDPYGYIEIGERRLEYALPGKAIEPVSYHKWLPRLNLAELQEKSSRRIQNEDYFQQVAAYVERVKRQQEDTRQSLKFDEVLAEQERYRKEREEFQRHRFRTTLQVFGLPEGSGVDEEKLRDWYEQLQSDMVIGEAAHLLYDSADLFRR
jgi:carboxyl-terminal processing protease